MNATAISLPSARTSGRRMLALIGGLLCLPFLIATLLWHFGWTSARQINHGELLATADRPTLQLLESDLQKILPDATLGTAGSTVFGHWTLALAVPRECLTNCLDQLQLARQVQVSLNKDMSRLRRALIGPQLRDTAVLGTIQQRWPDLIVARAVGGSWPTLAGTSPAPHLVLIDPQGRLVLRYSATPDPKGVRRDVERLLKYSWLG